MRALALWSVLLLCAAVSVGSLVYVVELTKDAPPMNCDFFINSLDCKNAVKIK